MRRLLEITRKRHAGGQTFDRQAPVYERKRAGLGLIRPGQFALALHDHLPRGTRFERVLDAGGGTGLLTRHIALWADEVEVMDISPGMLGVARRELSDLSTVRFVQADVFDTELEPGAYDCILCADVLHHMGRHAQLLDRLCPALATGGTLLVLEYEPRRLRTRLVTAIESLFLEDIHLLPPGRLQALCAERGVQGRAHPVSRWEYLYVGTRIPGGEAT